MKNSGSRYTGLRRSQIIIALTTIERQLERLHYGSVRDRTLRAERAELFVELRKRDDELIDKWRNCTSFYTLALAVSLLMCRV